LAGSLAIPMLKGLLPHMSLRGDSLKFRSILLPKLVRDELALQRLLGLARRRASALLPVLARTGPAGLAATQDDTAPKETVRHVE
jgi:hypothetical protein